MRAVLNNGLALLYVLRPRRLAGLPALPTLLVPSWSIASALADAFLPVRSALMRPDGLLAIGARLNSNRLFEANRKGIFRIARSVLAHRAHPRTEGVLFD